MKARSRVVVFIVGFGLLAFGVFNQMFGWTFEYRYAAQEYSYPNYQTGLVFFLGFAVIALLLRLHPRFGGLHQRVQQAYDMVIFLALLYLPSVVLLNPTADISETTRNTIFRVVGVLLAAVYITRFLLVPLLYRFKRYNALHRVLDVMQSLMPRNANIHNTRGHVFNVQAKFEKTIEAAERAIALTPPLKKKADEGWLTFKDWRLLNAHYLRMAAYFSLGQEELAFEDADIYVRLNPQDVSGYTNRGIVAVYRNDFASAEADFEAAIQLKPDAMRQAYLNNARANLAFAQHDNDQARSYAHAALDLPIPNALKKALYPSLYGTLALIELRESQINAAQEWCRKAEAIAPDNKLTAQALIYAQKGQWEQAITHWQQLIALAPRFKDLDGIRSRYGTDPQFVTLMEQIFARLESPAA